MDAPEVRYTKCGDVNIAYSVVGDGPFDLVFIVGWVLSTLEIAWDGPPADFFRRLGSFCRLILFDKRKRGVLEARRGEGDGRLRWRGRERARPDWPGVYVDPAQGATGGIHFASVLQRLGIAEAVKPKTTLVPGGYPSHRASAEPYSVARTRISVGSVVTGSSGTVLSRRTS